MLGSRVRITDAALVVQNVGRMPQRALRTVVGAVFGIVRGCSGECHAGPHGRCSGAAI